MTVKDELEKLNDQMASIVAYSNLKVQCPNCKAVWVSSGSTKEFECLACGHLIDVAIALDLAEANQEAVESAPATPAAIQKFSNQSLSNQKKYDIGFGGRQSELVIAKEQSIALRRIADSFSSLAGALVSIQQSLPAILEGMSRQNAVANILNGMVGTPWMDARKYKQLAVEVPVIIEEVMKNYAAILEKQASGETFELQEAIENEEDLGPRSTIRS